MSLQLLESHMVSGALSGLSCSENRALKDTTNQIDFQVLLLQNY